MDVVARQQPQERAEFIKKTYTHLAGAVGLFIVFETFLIQSGIAETLARALTGRFTWLAIFGFTLGLFFSVLMVGFAMAAILYDTSRVMLHYNKDQYVAASLELFASVALLFWYVLRILMSMSSRR